MSQTRQLAAIMFTDIVGYTALMGEDEQKAFSILIKNRELQKPIIEKYNGRWIKELGDGVMASFATVSDAVYAAKEIQQQCKQAAEFSLRIGLHQGEIVFDGVDVFGDAVNLASRIQTIAPVGAIYISETVHNNVANKAEIQTRFVKAEKLKNVKEPVRIYEIITETVGGSESKPPPRVRLQKKPLKYSLPWGLIITGIIILLAVIGFIYWNKTNRTEQVTSIAVLPFENRSTDPDAEYLGQGLAESLIYRLSQLPNLKVSPTSSVFRYQGKETELEKIANELQVNNIMSGRIIQRGENFTISVELVDVQNNKLLWGEQYERKMSELLATQREIAAEIANKLQLKLSSKGKEMLTKQYTSNNEAYQLYLKGRYHYNKRTKDDILKGIEYFQQAVKVDPNFALAYVGVSDSYSVMPSYAYLSPKEAFPQAKAAAQRALDIDPMLAEAHAAFAEVTGFYEREWTKAEREFKRAIELNPNVPEIHNNYGYYLQKIGRSDEAIRESKHALEMEPLSIPFGAILAGAYMHARQNDLALEQAKKTYNLEPNHPAIRFWLAVVYIANGMNKEAIALGEKELQNDQTNQDALYFTGYAYAKSGRRREAEEVIKKFKDMAKTQYVMSYYVASIYAALGDMDKAFAELEKSLAEGDSELLRLKVDPLIDPLRDDPRFKKMLKRLNLAE